jgi:dCMP deaminase
MTDRPSWDEYFFALAELVATRATCPRASVGAVLVKNKRVIGMGYNGSPPGAPHCLDEGCIISYNHCVRTTHAEKNALMNTTPFPYGASLYCTHEPCTDCRAELHKAGVYDLRWTRVKPDESSARAI